MQITCSICSDLFVSTDEVFGTKCGHIFHHQCLLQWLERSASCPQCRSKSTDKNIYRIYFNVLSTSSEDPNVLQNKIDNLHFQLRLKETDVKNYKDELEKMKEQNQSLRDFVKELEKLQRMDHLTIASLKEQIGILKKQNRNTERALNEAKTLREQLEFYKNVELVVNGSASEVDQMLDNCVSLDAVKSLATFTSVLKKEIESAGKGKKEALKKCRESEIALNTAKAEVRRLLNEISVLKSRSVQMGEDLKYSENERKSLQKKLKSMEEAMASPTGVNPSSSALKRLIQESPTPQLIKKSHLAAGHEDFPAGSSKEKAGESPYLNVKLSNIGLTPLRMPVTSRLAPPSKFSIFKKSRVNTLTERNANAEEFYNGLGGHSKLDDFPSPISSGLSQKKHRHLPVSRIKLKDASSNLKLDEFVSKS